MYTAFYGLREKPFSMAPHAGFFYRSHQHSGALNVLEYGLQEGLGLVLVTGKAGTGKTMLIEYLLSCLDGNVSVAVINQTGGSAENLVEQVLLAFGLEVDPEGFAVTINRLKEHATQLVQRGVTPVVVIDEAQQLSRAQLEQVRMFTNFHSQGLYLLQIVLVGQPEIKEVLQRQEFGHMAQRIAVSHNLSPLSATEIGPYIHHRLQAGGAQDPELFSTEAVEAIYRQSRGLPRLINLLCDASLVAAYAEGKERVDREIVQRVVQEWESTAFGQGQPPEAQKDWEPGRSPPATAVDSGNLRQTVGSLGQILNQLDEELSSALDSPRRSDQGQKVEQLLETMDAERQSLLNQLQGQELRINGLEGSVTKNLEQLAQALEQIEEYRERVIDSRVQDTEKELQTVSSDLDSLRGDVQAVVSRFEKLVSLFRELNGSVKSQDKPAEQLDAEPVDEDHGPDGEYRQASDPELDQAGDKCRESGSTVSSEEHSGAILEASPDAALCPQQPFGPEEQFHAQVHKSSDESGEEAEAVAAQQLGAQEGVPQISEHELEEVAGAEPEAFDSQPKPGAVVKSGPQNRLRSLRGNGAKGSSPAAGRSPGGPPGNGLQKMAQARKSRASGSNTAFSQEAAALHTSSAGNSDKAAATRALGKGSLFLIILGGGALALQVGLIYFLFFFGG